MTGFDWLLLAALIVFGVGCVVAFTKESVTHSLQYKSYFLVHKPELVSDAFYVIGFLSILVGTALCLQKAERILGASVLLVGIYVVATAKRTSAKLVREMQKDVKEPERAERQFIYIVLALFAIAVLLFVAAFLIRLAVIVGK